jgi:signal transduction histidine kinase
MFKLKSLSRTVGCHAKGLLWALSSILAGGIAVSAQPAGLPKQQVATLPQPPSPRRTDTAFINYLNKQAFILRINHAAQTRQLAKQALRLSQQLHYDQGLLNAYFSLGFYYRGASKYDSALYNTQQALQIAAKIHSDYDRTRGLYNLARIYSEQGDYSRALAANLQGLALAQSIHNQRAELFQLIQAGLIEIPLGEYSAAQVHFDQALRLAQSIKDKIGVGGAYSGLGDLNRQQAHWSLAGHYYKAAAASYQDVFNTQGMLPVELSIAEMTERQGDHSAALTATRQLLHQALQADWNGPASRAQLLISRIFLALNQADSASFYAKQSLATSRLYRLRPEIRDAAQVIAQADGQLEKWHQAYQYQALANSYADSLTGEDARRRVAGLQAQAAHHRQQIQLQLVQQQGRVQAQQQELTRLRYQQQLAGVVLLLTAIGVGLLWRYRHREVRRQEALRTRIAADLHDEVGSMLTQISMQSTLLREGRYAPAQQQLYLDQMAEASRRAARQMRDAVWSIDARYDSALSLLDRLRDHAHEVLPPAGLELDFRADAAIEALTVPLATRQALYYIYKEALHNVVKHAQARQVWVWVRVRQQQLELEVRDDGHGLASPGQPGGQGQRNMRMRAQAVGGRVTFDTAKGSMDVVVHLPLR